MTLKEIAEKLEAMLTELVELRDAVRRSAIHEQSTKTADDIVESIKKVLGYTE